jgi:myb proto-oncogene protein
MPIINIYHNYDNNMHPELNVPVEAAASHIYHANEFNNSSSTNTTHLSIGGTIPCIY